MQSLRIVKELLECTCVVGVDACVSPGLPPDRHHDRSHCPDGEVQSPKNLFNACPLFCRHCASCKNPPQVPLPLGKDGCGSEICTTWGTQGLAGGRWCFAHRHCPLRNVFCMSDFGWMCRYCCPRKIVAVQYRLKGAWLLDLLNA